MELEIKHLAPYLQYYLKLQYIVRGEVIKTGVMRSINHNPFETHPTKISLDFGEEEHIWMFKPILRPISDLTKKIKINNTEIIVKEILSQNLQMMIDIFDIPSVEDIKVYDYNKLLELHFDVFGLINKGLAIDINTLSVE